jgi:hypothetical protein
MFQNHPPGDLQNSTSPYFQHMIENYSKNVSYPGNKHVTSVTMRGVVGAGARAAAPELESRPASTPKQQSSSNNQGPSWL